MSLEIEQNIVERLSIKIMSKIDNIYVAASFAYEDSAKTSQRKDLIEKTVERIKKFLPGNYYLPHQMKVPNAWDMSLEEWSYQVFNRDVDKLAEADIILFLSFGKENNAGSAWEIGYTFGHYEFDDAYHKTTIMIKMTNDPESIMLYNSCDVIINEEDIEEYDWVKMPYTKVQLTKLS